MYSLQAPPAQTVLPELPVTAGADVTLHADSRKIRAGDIFIACQGEYVDGRSYIPAAIAQGAAFVFWDDDGRFQWNAAWQVPNLGIKDLRRCAGMVAAAVYGQVSGSLNIYGVTGTNGKTSITQWLAQAVDLLEGRPSCAITGTVGNGFWGRLDEATHTTPDPVSVQTLLRGFAAQGAKTVAMEVSSHGLDQFRVNGVPFRSAVFTNLTRDHLDYHNSMDEYGRIKTRLFYWQGLQHAVINCDDPFGAQLLTAVRRDRPELRSYGYGFSENADIRIGRFQAAPDGMTLTLHTPWGEGTAHTRLLGRFNAQNFAACVGVLCADGYPLPDVLDALGKIRPATGRMDCIAEAGKPLVVVDYAHTPDALEKALLGLQPQARSRQGRLWCVFGCGGNRDAAKRPLMGAVAARLADVPFITSDNPRNEEPTAIIEQIRAGMPADVPALQMDEDRARAIATAVTQAAANDVILLAGKGHEDYQEVRGEKRPFADMAHAQAALAQRAKEQA